MPEICIFIFDPYLIRVWTNSGFKDDVITCSDSISPNLFKKNLETSKVTKREKIPPESWIKFSYFACPTENGTIFPSVGG